MTKHIGYRPDIDGLRALAVVLVVLFHAKFSYFAGGFVGVDVFFVISGFLITGIIDREIRNEHFSLFKFYSKRAHRIFPSMILTIVVVWIFGFFYLNAVEFRQIGKHIVSAALFVNNIILWRESGYFDTSSDLKPLLHFWSLGIEEQFYFFWPITLLAIYRYRIKIIKTLIIILLVSFFANICLIFKDQNTVFYLPVFRFWELLFGSLLAILFNQGYQSKLSDLRWRNVVSFTGLLLVIAPSFILSEKNIFPGFWALLPVLGTFFMIGAGPDAFVNKNILANPLLIFIGIISYPLYLWHWPLLVFFRILFPENVSYLPILIALLISLVLSWLTYKLLEQKTRPMGKTQFKTIIIWLALGFTGVLGWVTFKTNGFENRFHKDLKNLAKYKFDRKAPWRVGKCFLLAEQGNEAFSDECLDAESGNKKQIIYLWGDSFAAALSPGLREVFSKNYRIAQYTASACPPLLGYIHDERPFCRAINDAGFERLKKLKPDFIVLAADWRNFHLKDLDKTITLLKQASLKKIIIIGPVPQWKDGLPRVLYKLASEDKFHKIPERTKVGLIEEMFEVDRMMNAKYNANYFSAISVFCNNDGCLTKTDDEADSLTAQDIGHLTTHGARYLFKSVQEKFLK